MDISSTLVPKSDQLDAVDLLGGSRVFTVASVSKGNVEQPVNVKLVEFDRPWRPSKNMRRVLAACWGPIASEWTGRRIELFCDPEVIYGGEKVGGIRIRALSHIDGPQQVPLLIRRGRSAVYQVEVLDTSAGPDADQIAACADIDQLRGWWQSADTAGKKLIELRVSELSEPQPAQEPDLLAGDPDVA